jgi:hypothetical protein
MHICLKALSAASCGEEEGAGCQHKHCWVLLKVGSTDVGGQASGGTRRVEGGLSVA